MAKVKNIAVPEPTEKGQLLGLSNWPNLTAKIYVRIFGNGEALITITPDRCLNTTSKPPVRSGDLIQNGLTRKASSKIKKVVRMIQHLVETNSKFKSCAFITLTYPKDWPDDKLSKKQLDHFLKRLRRLFPEILYVWVAERQTRGALHFHILTPQFVPKEFLNKAWSQIVQKWYKTINKEFTGVYPNVIKVLNAGAYLAKYMTKEGAKITGNLYGISMSARKLLIPVGEQLFNVPESEANEIILEALYSGKPIQHLKSRDPKENLVVWMKDAKDICFRLHEQIRSNSKIDSL